MSHTPTITRLKIGAINYRLQRLSHGQYRLDHPAADGWTLDKVGPWPAVKEALNAIVDADLLASVSQSPALPLPPSGHQPVALPAESLAALAPAAAVLWVLRGRTLPHGRQLTALGWQFRAPLFGYAKLGTAADAPTVRDFAASLRLEVHPYQPASAEAAAQTKGT